MPTNRTFGPADHEYDSLRSGFNLAVSHEPEMVVDATSAEDIVDTVRYAGHAGKAVAVMNTGHGPSVEADDAVLIRTGRMRRVAVDPVRRVARVEAGTLWKHVIDAAADYGLAPLTGSSPAVGTVGYTLGGGVGLLGRRFGFAADHVTWIDVVTSDGRLRRVSAESEPDLFWALRGAGANFGVVTTMEINLFPVQSLVGGELAFGGEACEEVVYVFAELAPSLPESMAASLMLLRYPGDPAVVPRLRGTHMTHLRVADSGMEPGALDRWLDRLRRIGPLLLDTVRVMPYREVGTIHHEPTDVPVAAYDRNILLCEFDVDAATVLSKLAGAHAEADFLTELRVWGGALSRPPAVPNVVGGRDAEFSLLAISGPDPEGRARRDHLLDSMSPWATGMTYPNFSGVEDTDFDAVRTAYKPDDLARLQRVKTEYDPNNSFRVNFNIPPKGA